MPAAKTVAVAPKPHLVPNLRSTWRKSTEHYIAQVKRFAIVFVGALLPQLLTNGIDHIGIDTVRALAPAALLITIRQLYPELGAASVDSAPGVTIVPQQLVDPAPTDAGHGDVASLGYLIVALVLVLIVLRIFHLV